MAAFIRRGGRNRGASVIPRLFVRPPGGALARSLYDSAVRQSRAGELYITMFAPDTTEGRFELLTVHVILLIDRLRELGETSLSQGVFDHYLSDLDAALREMGVGDLSVPKRMRSLGRAFYGRAASYRQALALAPDRGPLEDLIARTILSGGEGEPGPLAGYVLRCREHLSGIASVTGLSAWWPRG
jgi:cytochrome b pre-mRNA-processing protein 3